MGIAIAVVYLPLLALMTAIALALSIIPLRSASKDPLSLSRMGLAYVFGVVVTISFTLVAAWWYSNHVANEWHVIFVPLAISLFGPPGIGLVLLVLVSIVRGKTASFLKYFTAGAFHSTIAMPFVGAVAIATYDNIFIKPSFDQLCGSAGVSVLEKIPPAKSVAFIPEAFYTSNRKGHAYPNPRFLLLAPNTDLTFIEAQVHEWSGKNRYVRITLASRENNNTPKEINVQGPFVETTIENPSADYEVVPSLIPIAKNLSKRVHGQRIEVRRVSDKKVIAYAQYYWDTGKWWECPEGISQPGFIEGFIADMLNIPKR